MADPICTKAQLAPEGSCFNGKQFTIHEQLALEVYLRMQTVRAIGGTDYTGDEDALMIAAKNVFGGVENDQRRAMELTILANNADASGAAISANPNTLKGFIKVLSHYENTDLEAMRLYLMCAQGASKAYPQ